MAWHRIDPSRVFGPEATAGCALVACPWTRGRPRRCPSTVIRTLNFYYYYYYFSLTAKFVSLFHHHVILCLALPLVLPHTVSVSSNKHSFNPFHIDSRSPTPLLSSLYFTLSAKSFRTAASFNRHTLYLPTNFFFLFLTHSCKPILQTNNLCCCTHSSLPITLISVIFARSHFLTNI